MPAANYKQWVLPAFSTKEGDYKVTILRDSITNAFDFTPAATDVIELTSLRHFANIAKLKRRVDDGENLIVSDIADIEFLDSFQYSGTVNGTPITVDLRSENKSLFEHIFNDATYLYTLWISRRKVGGTWEHVFCGDFKRQNVTFLNDYAQSNHANDEVRVGRVKVELASAVERLAAATIADFNAAVTSGDCTTRLPVYGGILPVHYGRGGVTVADVSSLEKGGDLVFNTYIAGASAPLEFEMHDYPDNTASFGAFPERWSGISIENALDVIGSLSGVSATITCDTLPFRYYYKNWSDISDLYADAGYNNLAGDVYLCYNAVFGVNPNDGTDGTFSSPITYAQETPVLNFIKDVCLQFGLVAVFGITQSGANEGKLSITLKSRFTNSGSLPTTWINKLADVSDVKLENAKRSVKVSYRGDSDALYFGNYGDIKDALDIEIPFRTHAWSDANGEVKRRHMTYDSTRNFYDQKTQCWLAASGAIDFNNGDGWKLGACLLHYHVDVTNDFYPDTYDTRSVSSVSTGSWNGLYVYDTAQFGSDTNTRYHYVGGAPTLESALYAKGQFYANYFLNDRYTCGRTYNACVNDSDSIIDVQPFFTDAWNYNGAVTTFVAREIEFDLPKSKTTVKYHSGATPTTLTLYPVYTEMGKSSGQGSSGSGGSGSGTSADSGFLVSKIPSEDARNVIQPTADGIKALTIKGFSATHSDSYLENQKSDGTLYSKINEVGELVTYRQGAIQIMPYSTGAGNTGELRFYELAANGSHYVALKSADSQTASTTYTLPSALPAGTYLLQSTTGGVMSWVNPSTLSTDLSGAVILNPASLSRNFIDLTGDYYGVRIQAFSSQTNYLLWLENSSASFLGGFNDTAKLVLRGTTSDAALIQVTTTSTDVHGIHIKVRSAPSSSDSIIRIHDSTAATNHLIMGGTGLIGMNGIADSNAILRIVSSTGASGIGLKIKADSNSSSMPVVFEDSSANIVGGLNYLGVLSVGLSPATAGVGMARYYQATASGWQQRYVTENSAGSTDNIRSTKQFDVQTTDATVTTAFSFTTSSNTSYSIRVSVSGRKTNATAGNTNGYELAATFKDVSGTTTQVGTTTVLHSAENTVGWDCTIDNSGTSIRVRVTGSASNTVVWKGHIIVDENAG